MSYIPKDGRIRTGNPSIPKYEVTLFYGTCFIVYHSTSFCLDTKGTKTNSVESATLGYVQAELARSPRLNALFKT